MLNAPCLDSQALPIWSYTDEENKGIYKQLKLEMTSGQCLMCKTPIEAHNPRELQWCCASLSGLSRLNHKNDKNKKWCGNEHVEEELRKVCQHLFEYRRPSEKDWNVHLDSPTNGLQCHMEPIPCHDSLKYDLDKCQVCHHIVTGYEQSIQRQELQPRCDSSISCSSNSYKNDKEKNWMSNEHDENDLKIRCQLHPCVQLCSPKRGCDPSRDEYEMEFIDCQTTYYKEMCPDCQRPMNDHKQNLCIDQIKESLRSSPRYPNREVECMPFGKDSLNRCPTCLHSVVDHDSHLQSPRNEKKHDVCMSHNRSPNSSVSGGNGSHNCCSDFFSLSDPLYHQLQGITAATDIPKEIISRYQSGKRVWAPRSKKQNCIGCKTKESKLMFPVHIEPHPLRASIVKSKHMEMKKLRFCTGLHRGKGDILHPPIKGKLALLPVLALSRDATKGVWSRRSFQDEWECGHVGCCSQHWVSVLNPSKKVCHSSCRSMCEQELTTSKNAPQIIPTTKLLQKLHVSYFNIFFVN